MHLARVIGSVWCTRQQEVLAGAKYALLQPLDGAKSPDGDALVALDTLGAGPGEIVLYVTAFEATLPWRDRHPDVDVAGVDAAVVAIVDQVSTAGETT